MSAGPRRDLGRGEPDRGYPLRVVRDQQLSHQVRRAQWQKHHIAKFHFWEKLKAMPKLVVTAGGPMFQISITSLS